MDDDRKTNQELVEIRRELEAAPLERKRELFEAYVNAAHDGNQATIEDMPPLIIEYLRQEGEARYPSLLDLCDGSYETAAGKVMGLMLMHAGDGLAISIGEAADVCEELAAELVTGLKGIQTMTFTFSGHRRP